ncbi:MAG: gamma carbonic anhydrase family protein [Myxococcaceae bacterium]|nr:gamma carbonic anhydrase family protein [Myxococcaceae bacterium]
MAIERFGQLTPRIHPSAFVHAGAHLLGDVVLEEDASVWPASVMRGDCGTLTLGARSNLQDGSVVHATQGVSTTTIGPEVTVGHRVVLHGCTVGASSLIGMGAVLLDQAEVGEWSFIAAGALLTPRKVYPPRSFIVGSPAKRLREVTAQECEAIVHAWKTYVELARTYRSASSR